MAWNGKGDFLLECLVCLLLCHRGSQRQGSGFSLERAELMVKAIPCHVKWAGERHCETQPGLEIGPFCAVVSLGQGVLGDQSRKRFVCRVCTRLPAFAHSP